MKQLPPLIAVWTGSPLPKYALFSLEQFVRAHCGEVILISPGNPQISGVTWVDPGPLNTKQYEKFAESFDLDTEHRNGLWLRAYERFFIATEYARRFKVERGFLVELDALLWDLTGVSEQLDQQGLGVFFPEASKSAVVATLCYWNQIDSLSQMLNFFCSEATQINEMEALSLALRSQKTWIKRLPSEIDLFAVERDAAISNYGLGVFDAAGLGTWFFGASPHSTDGTIFNRSLTTATSSLPMKNLRVRLRQRELFISTGRTSPRWQKVRILHVPSKTTDVTANPLALRALLLSSRLAFRVPIAIRPYSFLKRPVYFLIRIYAEVPRYMRSSVLQKFALLISRLSFLGDINLGSAKRLSIFGTTSDVGERCGSKTTHRSALELGLQISAAPKKNLPKSSNWEFFSLPVQPDGEATLPEDKLKALLLQGLQAYGVSTSSSLAKLAFNDPESWPVVLAKVFHDGALSIRSSAGDRGPKIPRAAVGPPTAYLCSSKNVASYQQARNLVGAESLKYSWNFCPTLQVYRLERLAELFPESGDLLSWLKLRQFNRSFCRLADVYFYKLKAEGFHLKLRLGN